MNAAEVAQALRAVRDPELGLDIVTLGLVYGIECRERAIALTISVTSPHCPLGDVLAEGARAALRMAFPGYEPVVTLTFEPAWDVAMVDEQARRRPL